MHFLGVVKSSAMPGKSYLQVLFDSQLCKNDTSVPVQTASSDMCGCEVKCSGSRFEYVPDLSASPACEI